MSEEEMNLYFVELLSTDREAVEKDLAENPRTPRTEQLPPK